MPEDFEKDFYQTWSAAFKNIVKPEKLASWNELSPKYFVLDQNPESKRKPGLFFFNFSDKNANFLGLLKPEFISTNGNFYALAPKSYILTEHGEEGVLTKKGAKGDIFNLSLILYFFNS